MEQNISDSDKSEILVTDMIRQEDSDFSDLSSTATTASDTSSDRDYPYPAEPWKLLPSRYKITDPPKRFGIKWSETKVKLLNVVDKIGLVEVMFQDSKTHSRYQALKRDILTFYTSHEGARLRIPEESLKPGEIVAATVAEHANDTHSQHWRRVKVWKPVITCRRVEWMGICIDDKTQWIIIAAFSLVDIFYNHPVQSCRLKLSNFERLYPRRLFDTFREHEDFSKMTSYLPNKFLYSLIEATVWISDMKRYSNDEDVLLVGKLNLAHHRGRMEPICIEAFCDFFRPKIPKIGELEVGQVAHIEITGAISICLKSSLLGWINGVINSYEVRDQYCKIKEDHTNDWESKIIAALSRKCVTFLSYDVEENLIYRVEVISFYIERKEMTVLFMDKGVKGDLKLKDLLCPIAGNPNLPVLLAVIPPQAARYQICGVDGRHLMDEDDSKLLSGKTVSIKVVELPAVATQVPKIVLYDACE